MYYASRCLAGTLGDHEPNSSTGLLRSHPERASLKMDESGFRPERLRI